MGRVVRASLFGILFVILLVGFVFAVDDSQMKAEWPSGVNETDAVGGPKQYGECGDGICNYGENTSTYVYYCPQDCNGSKVITQAQIFAQEKFREKIQNGYTYYYNGTKVEVKAMNQTRVQIKSKNISANSDLNFTENINGTKISLKIQLSNGKNAEVKVMPDVAAEMALARIRVRVCSETNNCTLELKEVGEGNQNKLMYEVQVKKQAKVFGLFRAQMQIKTQVDAENGEVVQTNRPWWSFLASEEDELEE